MERLECMYCKVINTIYISFVSYSIIILHHHHHHHPLHLSTIVIIDTIVINIIIITIIIITIITIVIITTYHR